MFAVYIVVALHHLEHRLPSVGKIFQFVPLYLGLVGIFQIDPVIELYIEVDLSLSQVANAEGNHCAIAREGRIVFILRIFSSRILMYGVVFNYMQIILRFLALDGDLVTTVFLHAFVEALDLVHGQQVVEADRTGQLKQTQNQYYQGVAHELIIKIVAVESLWKLSSSQNISKKGYKEGREVRRWLGIDSDFDSNRQSCVPSTYPSTLNLPYFHVLRSSIAIGMEERCVLP